MHCLPTSQKESRARVYVLCCPVSVQGRPFHPQGSLKGLTDSLFQNELWTGTGQRTRRIIRMTMFFGGCDVLKMETVCLSETLITTYTALHPTTTSSSSPPWKPSISQEKGYGNFYLNSMLIYNWVMMRWKTTFPHLNAFSVLRKCRTFPVSPSAISCSSVWSQRR
jgi:hypothetical protein